MTFSEFYESIDRSHYVKAIIAEPDEVIGLITWNGSHTLNFYNTEGV